MRIFFLSFLAATVFFLLLYFLVFFRLAPKTKLQNRLRNLQHAGETDYHKSVPIHITDLPFWERIVTPFFKELEERIIRLAPHELRGMLERRIMLAGKQHVWRVDSFISAWFFSLVTGLVFAGIFVLQHELIFVQNLMCMLLGGAFGAAVPFIFLNFMIQDRQQKIRHQLPEVLDLLCVSVQAGLSFDGAMRKIVDRMKGPLIDECARMLRDVRMGMMRYTAMQNLAMRCDLEEVHLFVTAIVQAERLGTSMGNTLAIQADNMRERRRQYIKAEAMKAPVKIVFPLVLFIFPALFVVLLLPTLLNLYKSFTNM